MASSKAPNSSTKSKFGFWQIMMFLAVTAWAAISLLPFFAMITGSLMTQTEAMGGDVSKSFFQRLLPGELEWGSDISNCIVLARDTEFDPVSQQDVTKTRFVIEVDQSVVQAQGYGFFNSTTGSSSLDRERLMSIPFFSNYCAAWHNADLGRYMVNTVFIVLITISGSFIITILSAYAFARLEFFGKELMFTIMLATLMIPEIVTNLPNLLIFVGIENWLETTWVCAEAERCLVANWPILTIPFMAQAINIFLVRQHFATIPKELWEAARMDGATHLRFLAQIVLPLSRPVLFVIILFTFISAWNSLAWPLLATPGDDTWRPIAVGLQQFLDDEGPLPHLRMAGAVITIIPVLILYIFTQKQFIEGLSQSGLKG